MKNQQPERKVFRTAQAIMEEYDMTRSMFNHFIKLGMPVRVEKGCFWGHKDNIDKWFQQFTYCRADDETMAGVE